MTREEELMRIAKKLDKMVSRNNTEGALDLLTELKSFNMTLKLLQETRIGMSVNGIRKHSTDEEVTALAKFLIKDWKRLLDSGNNEKSPEDKNGLESPSHSSPRQSHSRRLDLKQDLETDTKPSDANRKEKLNHDHKQKRIYSYEEASPSNETHPVQTKPAKSLEEDKKQRVAEQRQQEADSKRPKHFLEPQGEKLRGDQKRERSLEEHRAMRREEERRDRHPEASKRHSSLDDVRRSREEHHRERPIEIYKPLFERKESSDSKPAHPQKRPSSDSKPDRRESSDSKRSSSPPAKKLSGERRESHGSKVSVQAGAPNRKLSTDSTDGKGKVDVPKTPTTPTSPMSPGSAGPLSPNLSTGDSVRDKCIAMITAALRTDNDYKEFGVNCDSMAAEIEDYIYQEIKATDMKYKNRVRSRISNLKDPKNPGLRKNVLAGSIELSRIASMTAEEMASDELKQLRNVMTQEAIREHQMAKTGGTTTDLLQCGKCKKKNCTYNQVQTRSADEPMTTFVLCNECGNRWKFC